MTKSACKKCLITGLAVVVGITALTGCGADEKMGVSR